MTFTIFRLFWNVFFPFFFYQEILLETAIKIQFHLFPLKSSFIFSNIFHVDSTMIGEFLNFLRY